MARKKQKPPSPVPFDYKWALLANGLVLAVLLYAAVLQSSFPDFYRQSVQEDEYLEWATFWAFMLAAFFGFAGGLRHWRQSGRFPWFLTGVGLFCVFIALEEISWGQRILGYRPPAYFLEHNFQQELNLHNLPSTVIRKMALNAVILGYGVVLPLLEHVSSVRRVFRRIGIQAPTLTLAPAFFLCFYIYRSYPWRFTGEIVELALGLGFLFALLDCWRREKPDPEAARAPAVRWLLTTAGLWTLVVILGLAHAAMNRVQPSVSPETFRSAQVELEALKVDLLAHRGRLTSCGLHKRVYSWVEKYHRNFLYSGIFAALKERGLPSDRADFFLDPWNSPYWIRHECSRDRRRGLVMIYSFGPNRRRESTGWEVGGDDLATIVQSSGIISEKVAAPVERLEFARPSSRRSVARSGQARKSPPAKGRPQVVTTHLSQRGLSPIVFSQ